MRRQALTSRFQSALGAFAAGVASLSLGCGLDVGGLAAASDASAVSVGASTLDGSVALDQDAGSSASSSSMTNPMAVDAGQDEPAPFSPADAGAAAADVAVAATPDAAEGSEGDSGDNCDRDQDGFRSNAAECGGTDCCDFDQHAHPGETDFFTSADACGSFDYDCDGKADPEFGKVGCQLGILSCSGSGFDGNPPGCGDTATFDACDFFVLCYVSQSQKVEACR